MPAHSVGRAVLAVVGVFSLFAAAQALWTASRPVRGDVPVANATVPVALAPGRVRCPTCGIIEAIDRREAGERLSAAWIFSVRMPDGSLRRSPDALRGRWKVGDGMQLIGGERTWNRP